MTDLVAIPGINCSQVRAKSELLHPLTITSPAQDTCGCVLEAIEHGWEPALDAVGQGAKEVLQLMSWLGRRNAIGFVRSIKPKIASCLLQAACSTLKQFCFPTLALTIPEKSESS